MKSVIAGCVGADIWQWCDWCASEPGMSGSAAFWWCRAALQLATHCGRGCL